MKDLGYFYSVNEQDFEFSEIEDAVESALDNLENPQVGDEFCVQQGEPFKTSLSSYLCLDRILEDIVERQNDFVQGDYDDWLSSTDIKLSEFEKLEASMKALLDNWADEYKHHPRRYPIRKVKPIRYKVSKIDCNGECEAEEVTQ